MITGAQQSVFEHSSSSITIGAAGVDDIYAIGYNLEDIREK
jgi:hypothetical protein